MGLFNQILNALDNPNQAANSQELSNTVNTMQQVGANSGANPNQMQSLLSVVGGYVRSALQEKRATQGEQQTQAIVNQFSGTSGNSQALYALFSLPQIQQMIQVASQHTGMDANTIEAMLPMIVPLILNLLQSGTPVNQSQGNNSVLHSFLDANRDGDVDIADVMQTASRFFSP